VFCTHTRLVSRATVWETSVSLTCLCVCTHTRLESHVFCTHTTLVSRATVSHTQTLVWFSCLRDSGHTSLWCASCVCDSCVCDSRVCDSCVCDSRVCDSCVCDSCVCDSCVGLLCAKEWAHQSHTHRLLRVWLLSTHYVESWQSRLNHHRRTNDGRAVVSSQKIVSFIGLFHKRISSLL